MSPQPFLKTGVILARFKEKDKLDELIASLKNRHMQSQKNHSHSKFLL